MSDTNYQIVSIEEQQKNKQINQSSQNQLQTSHREDPATSQRAIRDRDLHTNMNIRKNRLAQKEKGKTYFLILLIFMVSVLLVVYYILMDKLGSNKLSNIQQIFNQQNTGVQFGKYDPYIINLTSLNIDQNQILTNSYYLQDASQIISKSRITKKIPTIDFNSLQQQLSSKIAYSTYKFPEHKPSNLHTQKHRKSKLNEQIWKQNNFRSNLAIELVKNTHNLNDNQVYQREYSFFDTFYNIGTLNKQIPICIFSEGGQVFAEDVQKYFNSLENLNYDNFHIVYVNQYSKQTQKFNIYQFLQSSNRRIKNKIRIINNNQFLGTLANMYFWIKKYCGDDDLVLVLGKNEEIIGRQALNIINSYYQSSSKFWYSSVNFILNPLPLYQNYTIYENYQIFRLFKKKMIDSIPLQAIIDYKYNKDTGQAWPKFFISNINQFQDYFQFQNIQKQAKNHINQYLLLSSKNVQNCSIERLIYHNSLLILKNKLEMVSELGVKSKINQNYSVSSYQFQQNKIAYRRYSSCQYKLFNKKDERQQKQEKNIIQPIKNQTEKQNKQIQAKKERFYKQSVHNIQNIGKQFGKSDKFILNLTNYIPKTQDIWNALRPGTTKTLDDSIYVLTPTDLNQLIKKIDFQKVKQDMVNSIPYEILEFQKNFTNDRSPPQLNYSHFKNEKEIQLYLQKYTKNNSDININVNKQFQFITQLFFQPTKQEILQAQFYYFNKKYNFTHHEKEVPICIFTAQRNIFTKKQYKQYFDSIERLNYSNYHIVYVDDMSNDDSAIQIYDFVNNGSYSRIKNRMKIIHNLQSLGGLGNMYFWTQKFCNQNDVVVNLDGDDSIIGTQSFKILSSTYEDENIWYVYSKYMDYNPDYNITGGGGVSSALFISTTQYRRSNMFHTSHMRTYRLKLMKAVPLYQFIEYHYNATTKLAWSTFPTLAFDVYQVYAHFELSGNERIKFIPEYFYAYYFGSKTPDDCFIVDIILDHLKASIRTPLDQIDSFDQKGKQIVNDTIPEPLYKSSLELIDRGIRANCFDK